MNSLAQVHEDAKALRALISDESRWTKQVYARDSTGRQCRVYDEDAACWCLVGGMSRVAGVTTGISAEGDDHTTRLRFHRLFEALGQCIPVGDPVSFNDDAKWRQVDEALTSLVLSTAWRDSPTSC